MKNKQAIFFLFAANTISGLAQGVTMQAIPWYFVNEAGRQGLYGILYAVITALSLIWMLYSGTLIDRFERKHIFMGYNAAGALMFLSLAGFGFYSGSLSIPLVSLAFASTFFIYNIHFPNVYAFAQEITAPKDYSRIISYLEIQHQLTMAISGVLGAILLKGVDMHSFEFLGTVIPLDLKINAWTISEILLMDGSTYVLAFLSVALIKYKRIAPKKIDRGSIKERLKSGFTYLQDRKMLFLFGTLSYALFITVIINTYFIVPKYASSHLDSDINVYSFYRMFFAFGSFMAGLTIRYIFKNIRPALAVIILASTGVLFYYVGVFNYSLAIFYALSLLLGLSNAGIRIMRATFVFQRVDNSVIGRVQSVFNLFHISSRLMFALLFSLPFFAMGDNILYAYIILGIFVTAAILTLGINYNRIIRSYED